VAVFLPFELAAWMLQQFSGIQVSDDTLWNWVQSAGQQAAENLKLQLQQLRAGQSIPVESLDETLLTMPLIIAADGVTVGFHTLKLQRVELYGEGKSSIISTSRQMSDQNRQDGNSFTSTTIGGMSDIDHLKSRLQLGATARHHNCFPGGLDL